MRWRKNIFLSFLFTILCLGLLVQISMVDAKWRKRGDGSIGFEIQRACQDGFIITTAFTNVSDNDNYPENQNTRDFYARMYPIDVDSGYQISGDIYDNPDQYGIPSGTSMPVVGSGSLIMDHRTVNLAVLSNDGSFLRYSTYYGNAVIPWSTGLFDDKPHILVFNDGILAEAVDRPAPTSQYNPVPSHQPGVTGHQVLENCYFFNGTYQDVAINQQTDTTNLVSPGGILTYSLTVSNLFANVAATGVVFTDTLPEGTTLVSASTTRGRCTSRSNVVTCNIGQLAGNANPTASIAEITIQLNVSASAPSLLTNVGSVRSDRPDPTPGNNTNVETTFVNYGNIIVNVSDEQGFGNPNLCSLTDAINAANTDTPVGGCVAGSGDDVIEFSPLLNDLTTDFELPPVTSNLIIDGTNLKDPITTSFFQDDAAFIINSGNVTFRNFRFRPFNTDIIIANYGGNVLISNVDIDASYSSERGILNQSQMRIERSSISRFTMAGVINAGSGSLTISNSTIAANDAYGIINDDTPTATPTLLIVNSTIADQLVGITNQGFATVQNSIIALNTLADCEVGFGNQPIQDVGPNISPDTDCGFSITADPLLGPLQYNGGLTRTMALLRGSRAINSGDNTICKNDPVNNLDQRGLKRPRGTKCDLGAYESGYEASNPAVVAVADRYTTQQNMPLSITLPGVLSNDSGSGLNTLTAEIVTNPRRGTLTLDPDGSFVYTPNLNFKGSDRFVYRAFDGSSYSANTSVSIKVLANRAPRAVNDSFSVGQDLTISANGVLVNDTDPDRGTNLLAVKVSDPANGTLNLNSDGSFVYTPNTGFKGKDSFTYQASDGALTSNIATVSIIVVPPDGSGTGLLARYFNNQDLSDLAHIRVDPLIDFSWRSGAPDPSIGPDTFSARWLGQVQPRYDETYTFYVVSDNGARLWVNDHLLIDDWALHPLQEKRGTITLTGGQLYNLRLEYYEQTSNATIKLLWSSSTQVKEIIPRSQLYPATPPTPLPPGTGTGLFGLYYDAPEFSDLALTRIDAAINFDWARLSPDPLLQPDTFSVRWSGQVQPLYTDLYTFHVFSDNGARLRVNGQLIIDDWRSHSLREGRGTIALQAGQLYDIQLEYYETTGAAAVQLLWSSDSQIKQLIPPSELYPADPPTVSPGDGNGLLGEYFTGTNFSALQLARTDTEINFDWGIETPAPEEIEPDFFSIRWTGEVQPLFTNTYTFYTVSDDGVRLWVNNVLLIDDWTDHTPTENQGRITLEAGQSYSLRLEYYENVGSASISLLWSSDSQAQEVIPQSQLYSNPALMSSDDSMSVPVNEPPTLETVSEQVNIEGDMVTLQISAVDPESSPLRYTVANLPGGLTLDAATGLINGQIVIGAAVSSPYQVIISVIDTEGATVETSFSWTITPNQSCDAPDAIGDPCNHDEDGDGQTDDIDVCPLDITNTCVVTPPPVDNDGDGIVDSEDVCPADPVHDAIGNPCNHDEDADGIADDADQCPLDTTNTCLSTPPLDSDGDGIPDSEDACPLDSSNTCVPPPVDSDGDGLIDTEDVCPADPAHDSVGDPCNHDEDADGIADDADQCPSQSAPDSVDGCLVVLANEEEVPVDNP